MAVTAATNDHESASSGPWWREVEVLWLLILVLAAYFTRAHVLPIRGEEPTRAQVAREMVERGDWIVPREQGEPFLVRPPLQNWTIALSCLGFGNWGPFAVRFHSLAATLLTTLLIYGYARTFLSRLGALAGAAAFATLADMFQMGRQAETEALFTCLVSASMLLWHWGQVRGWPAGVTYTVGYALMALATLTKGVQAPTYFLGAMGIYLLVAGQWRQAFSRAHLLGIAVGAGILLAWIVPYAGAVGWSKVGHVWLGDPAVRYNGQLSNWRLVETARHLFVFPLEVFAGTLPWSIFLPMLLHRDLRRCVGRATPQVLFLGIAVAVAFPTCWLPPGGLPRYFAPLFPALAILVGFVIERITDSEAAPLLRLAWRNALATCAAIAVAAAVAAVALAALAPETGPLSRFKESWAVAVAYAAVAAGLALVMARSRRAANAGQVRLAVLALAGFLVMTFTGVITNVRLRTSEHADEAMRAVKQELPPGQQLVSIGRVNGRMPALFAYHYGLPFITPQPWPTRNNGGGGDLDYFCFMTSGDARPALPFAWEEIGAVSLDRNRQAIPKRLAVVGRRLPAQRSPEGVPAQATNRSSK
ncbi:MAG: glycosyltransferase family 39 protein [Gemmataceae bacterium]|nr:glycosyltransferase family 39 protein [Gemmataceae bacterium]